MLIMAAIIYFQKYSKNGNNVKYYHNLILKCN